MTKLSTSITRKHNLDCQIAITAIKYDNEKERLIVILHCEPHYKYAPSHVMYIYKDYVTIEWSDLITVAPVLSKQLVFENDYSVAINDCIQNFMDYWNVSIWGDEDVFKRNLQYAASMVQERFCGTSRIARRRYI